MFPQYLAYMDSPLGRILLRATDEGLTAAHFVAENEAAHAEATPEHPILQATKAQLQAYFAGERKTFDVPLAPAGSDFQKRVWQELLNIPWGSTTSYLNLAEKLGSKLTIRAVGGANGKNPIAIILPCHRVIGSDGSLTGYAGGLWRKQWLLALEGWPKESQLQIPF